MSEDEGQIELASGTLAVVAPTKEGGVLVGFYARGILGPGRLTADEWDAFKAMVDREFGQEATVSDPTRLDPPIAAIIMVDVEGGAALRHLNRLHGFPDGTMPLSVKGSEEHVEATSRLLRGHRVRLLVTAIDRDGTPTFELAPKEPR